MRPDHSPLMIALVFRASQMRRTEWPPDDTKNPLERKGPSAAEAVTLHGRQ